MSHKILHLDLDAFYASVEQLDHPDLRGRPVVVGGSINRGVVSAASYEARAFGIRSAMPMARAVRLCPEAAVRPVRMGRYREVSRQVFAVFARYTDRVEPLSIDEAFLDVSGCERLFGPAPAIAERIRREVRKELGLTVSAGVAPNKFLAKLASEAGKPDGLVVVPPEEIDAFLLPLPVSKLWGVGEVTAQNLAKQGFKTVADLRRASRQRLEKLLGSVGRHLYRLARGEDDRPVVTEEEVKSIGHEETFEKDLATCEEIRRVLLDLSERVARRLRRQGVAGGCVTLKVRYADFATVTRSRSFAEGLDSAPEIFRIAGDLLERTEAGIRPVRLLGIYVSSLAAAGAGQMDLFGERRHRRAVLDRAVDELTARFGEKGVRPATLLEGEPEVSRGKKGGDVGQGA